MIPAWTVTSSAVVGSSAISSDGWQASAMAIAMRCRMPPENWCGYDGERALGVGDAARRRAARPPARARPSCAGRGVASGGRSSAARSRASGAATSSGPGRPSRARCRDVWRSERPLSFSRSVPPNIARPSTVRRAAAAAAAASASSSCRCRSRRRRRRSRPARPQKSMPSTSVIGPLSLGSLTRRSSTSSSGAISGSAARATRGSRTSRSAVAEEVEREHDGEDRQPGERADPPAMEVVDAPADHRAPLGGRRLGAEPEEREARRAAARRCRRRASRAPAPARGRSAARRRRACAARRSPEQARGGRRTRSRAIVQHQPAHDARVGGPGDDTSASTALLQALAERRGDDQRQDDAPGRRRRGRSSA